MLSLRRILPVMGLCMLAIGTALPVLSEENARDISEARETIEELVNSWVDGGDENDASLRLEEKLAADMNQHLTAFEGDEDGDAANEVGDDNDQLVNGDVDGEEEEDMLNDELVVDNAEDVEAGDDDETSDAEDEEGEIRDGEEEEEDEAQNAAHKDADEDRFASDAINALYPNNDDEDSLSSVPLQPNIPEDDEIQDEVADENEAFGEESDNDMDMMGDFDHSLVEQASLSAVPDEENVRNNDEAVGMPFSPKEE